MTSSDQRIWLRDIERGRSEPPPLGQNISVGPFTAVLLGADLRYVRLGEREIVRRITVAVRDAAWATIEPVNDQARVNGSDGADEIVCDVAYRADPISFDSRIRVTGLTDGLEFALDGTSLTEFSYNRIGICVLLPPAEYAGAHYVSHGPSGQNSGLLPKLVGPQLIEGEVILPLFPAFESLELALTGGVTIEMVFTGEQFEMEDQRNWTDASFKIYSPPLALPRPRVALPTSKLHQTLSIRLRTRPT